MQSRRKCRGQVVGKSKTLRKKVRTRLFPVSVRELAAEFHFHELPAHVMDIGEFQVNAQLIIHPNPTIGYRIQSENAAVTYLPDHEPALGGRTFGTDNSWTSGYRLAQGADLLIHDTQYTEDEYQNRLGFGHSSIRHAFQFAGVCDVKHFAPFHHDPTHNDDTLDRMFEQTMLSMQPTYKVTPSREGLAIDVTH